MASKKNLKGYPARIIINDSATDGLFTKKFILKLHEMGAFISVEFGNEGTLDLSNLSNLNIFKSEAI